MELSFNEMVGLHQETTQYKFIEEIQKKQADIRRKVANFENFFTKLSSVLTSRTQIKPQLEKSRDEYPEEPIINLEIIKTKEKADVFQSLSKFTEDDIHYFARPTIDRIFHVQKILQEEYDLQSDEEMKLNKDERESDLKEGRLARKLLPDPLSPKKIENSSINERRKIPKTSANILKNWLLDHIDDPYPSKQEKRQLAQATKLSFKQVQNWFINARGRGWKQLLKREKFSREVEKKLLDTNPNALEALKAKEYV